MRAVNLLPSDAQHGSGGGLSLGKLTPTHGVIAALVIVLAYVTLYVITGNTITQRKAQLASLHQQLTAEQAQVTALTSYTSFEQMAQQRAQTVKQIANSRFDWHLALTDLSKVMPANASLQSLIATVAPGVTIAGAGGSTAGSSISSVRSDVTAPAFEIKGCTRSQDDVARIISRLRLINDVQRVTLEDSVKATSGSGGAASTASPSAGSGSATTGCAGNGPTFDLVVFFQPLAGALPATGSGQQASTSTASSAPAAAGAAK